MKATNIKGLGAKAQEQIRAALANGTGTPVTKKRAPKPTAADGTEIAGVTLRCCGPDCGHTETSWQKMDKHCDDVGHHRYEAVLT